MNSVHLGPDKLWFICPELMTPFCHCSKRLSKRTKSYICARVYPAVCPGIQAPGSARNRTRSLKPESLDRTSPEWSNFWQSMVLVGIQSVDHRLPANIIFKESNALKNSLVKRLCHTCLVLSVSSSSRSSRLKPFRYPVSCTIPTPHSVEQGLRTSHFVFCGFPSRPLLTAKTGMCREYLMQGSEITSKK